MPRLSKKTMFALEAVLDVAFHVGENPVRSGDITERQRIPKRYLEQVLQHLVRAGILAGDRILKINDTTTAGLTAAAFARLHASPYGWPIGLQRARRVGSQLTLNSSV